MYTIKSFMKCTHVCAAQKTYYFFTKLQIETDFPCLADEIVEPRPYLNIEITAFTGSDKLYYTWVNTLHAGYFFMFLLPSDDVFFQN